MLLLDTCALIFDALQPHRLTARARSAIDRADASGRLALSDISLWETAMLAERGRLEIDTAAEDFLRLALAARGIRVLSISVEIAARSTALEMHKDPADRIIAATAIEHRARLVTSDEQMRRDEQIPTLW
jgi:PIN domain nuclease of toxin-antitoxin system